MTQKQTAFLAAYAETGSITRAAKAAGCHRCNHTKWLADEDYATAFKKAQAEASDALEGEARRRAVEGLKRYKFNRNGEPIRHPETGEPYCEHVYSDTLLIFLLKGNAPEKFGDRIKQEHSGDVNHHQGKVIREVLDAIEGDKRVERLAEEEALSLYGTPPKLPSTAPRNAPPFENN